MPGWKAILDEVKEIGSGYDVIRRRHLAELYEVTGRNVIVYYSGWLQKEELARQGVTGFDISDADKNGFMAAIHDLDRDKGLDILLHTPGGDLAATESLIDYLRSMFDADIRAIIPQLAMSAGTVIALACQKIIMGKHSSLGPIDPQIFGMPAHGILEEFNVAREEIATDPSSIALWQPILSRYTPTLIGRCQKAIEWGNEMAKELLITGMFKGDTDAKERANKVVEELTDNLLTKNHARHLSSKKAKRIGLNVMRLEDDQDLQEAVLTVHHACIQTLADTPAIKLIENHKGVAYVSAINVVQAPSR